MKKKKASSAANVAWFPARATFTFLSARHNWSSDPTDDGRVASENPEALDGNGSIATKRSGEENEKKGGIEKQEEVGRRGECSV